MPAKANFVDSKGTRAITVKLVAADIAASPVELFTLPERCRITGASIDITDGEEFVAASTLDVGTVADPDFLIDGAALDAHGKIVPTIVHPLKTTGLTKITATLAGAGAATAVAYLTIEFMLDLDVRL